MVTFEEKLLLHVCEFVLLCNVLRIASIAVAVENAYVLEKNSKPVSMASYRFCDLQSIDVEFCESRFATNFKTTRKCAINVTHL